MSKYLFLFTVGPVQSFIAQARKTQDLYAGSQILTELVKAGIEEVGRENIIFPYAYLKKKDDEKWKDFNQENDEKWKSTKSLPNRFLAVVEKDESKLKTLGEQVETAVRAEFTRLSSQILKEKVKNRGDNFDNLFFNQIERHLDIHWVFSPLDEDNYQQSYKATEALLGSVKNVRPFEQFETPESLGEAGRKCSLDGENNALFFGKGTSNRFFSKKWNSFAEELTGSNVIVQTNEGLSGVSFIKRFFNVRGTRKGFDSTTEIAMLKSLEELNENKTLSRFKDVFDKDKIIEICEEEGTIKMNGKEWETSFNEQFYYEENLNEKYIPCKAQLNIAKKRHRNLQKVFKENNVKFDKYYALIMFDGDKIGEKLSKATSPKQHEYFSKSLALFASKAREILQDKGQTVYTGGDDFLGFVNLHYLFEVMNDLRNQFKTLVSDEAQKILKIDEEFTFSAGIVIAHYKTPLAEVLKTVRKVEKKAKNDGGRNAFCITAMKHSGEIQEAVLKWGDDNKNWIVIKKITEYLQSKDDKAASLFSGKFIQNLTVELYQLGGVKAEADLEGYNDAIKCEIKRLVKRSAHSSTSAKQIEDLQNQVIHLWESYELDSMGDKVKRIKNFIHALQIADFLSCKTN